MRILSVLIVVCLTILGISLIQGFTCGWECETFLGISVQGTIAVVSTILIPVLSAIVGIVVYMFVTAAVLLTVIQAFWGKL